MRMTKTELLLRSCCQPLLVAQAWRFTWNCCRTRSLHASDDALLDSSSFPRLSHLVSILRHRSGHWQWRRFREVWPIPTTGFDRHSRGDRCHRVWRMGNNGVVGAGARFVYEDDDEADNDQDEEQNALASSGIRLVSTSCQQMSCRNAIVHPHLS